MDFESIDFSEMDGDEIYDYGCDFLDDGNIDNAIKCIIIAAEKGCIEAQFHLAELYRYGEVVEGNFEESLKWYKLAAENGNRDAIYTLGHVYYYGDKVEQDYKEAYYWFDKDGFRELPYYICADMYFYVDNDYDNAFKLYRFALEEGVYFAAYKIGEMYYYGLGLEQSYDEAVKYLKYFEDEFDEMFADEAPAKVHYMLAEMYKNGWGVEQDLGLAENYLKLLKTVNGNAY